MRNLIVSTFASLDGIIQAPGGPEEDPTGGFALGGWMFGYGDETKDISASGFEGKDRELVLGRRTIGASAHTLPGFDQRRCDEYLRTKRRYPARFVRQYRGGREGVA
jgi:hypothetical protein